MKKDCGFPQSSFIASSLVTSTNSFAKQRVAASPSMFEIAVRIGRVEQMLADNKAMLCGAR